MKKEITQELLKELFHYDPLTGIFTRIKKTNNRCKIGEPVGYLDNGYFRISIYDKLYLLHRLAWLYTYGSFPVDMLDHINGISDDNRLINLREATVSENNSNSTIPVNNTSGYKGVSWNKKSSKWVAQISHNNKKIGLGYFSTPEEADKAYKEASAKYHKEFARL